MIPKGKVLSLTIGAFSLAGDQKMLQMPEMGIKDSLILFFPQGCFLCHLCLLREENEGRSFIRVVFLLVILLCFCKGQGLVHLYVIYIRFLETVILLS